MFSGLTTHIGKYTETPWYLIFGFVIWLVWLNRTNIVFNNADGRLDHIRFLAMFKAHEVYESLHGNDIITGQQRRYHQVAVGWVFPDIGWTKCNVDGSVKQDQKVAACGGVFRDASGAWIFGFCHNLGSSSVVVAEIWGLISALYLAWDRGIRRLILEADSKLAINFVKEGVHDHHPLSGLVAHARRLLNQNWEVKLSHVFREGNCVADFLADFAHQCPLGVQILEDPPPGCGTLILNDASGVSFMRSVLS